MNSNSNWNIQELFSNMNLGEIIISSILAVPLAILGSFIWSKIEQHTKKGKEKKKKLERDAEEMAMYYKENLNQYYEGSHYSTLMYVLSLIGLILSSMFIFQNSSYLHMKYMPEFNIFKEGLLKSIHFLSAFDMVSLACSILLLIPIGRLVFHASKSSYRYARIGKYLIKESDNKQKVSSK